MIPEDGPRRLTVEDRLRRELLGVVQSGYIICAKPSILECELKGADDFHRLAQLYHPQSFHFVPKQEPPQLAFTHKFQWGCEGGFRTARFELVSSANAEFLKKYGDVYRHALPQSNR